MTVAVEDLQGRMVDCDTHLYVAPYQFPAAFGEDFAPRFRAIHERTFGKRDVVEYARPLDEASVWRLKHWDTPAGYDVDERMATLNMMGVDRQLLFADGIVSSALSSHLHGAWTAVQRYNDFGLDWSRPSKGRLRPASVLPLHDVEAATAEARRLIAAGAYGFSVYCGAAPGGFSPADMVWDPLWSMLEEADTPLLLHSGSESGFLDKRWSRGTPIDAGPAMGAEGGPFTLAMSHLGPQVFVSTMIIGGVLERHPRLRLGILEFLASWIGPLAELLDQSVDYYPGLLTSTAPLKPSEYINRQVRATPFYWEPLHRYIERYGLEDVYVFSTDFPHSEGGLDPVGVMHESMSKVGDTAVEKFFVHNGRWLMPDLDRP
ncbi:amidohydrolase family protein [Plantactinospora sp. WMMC1484]|uniref:amidohydrolase family protein n=1 Tax=Plantactinospora sp. WMMC1484 TaxID=3404122 RepID=UPI003BF5EEA5